MTAYQRTTIVILGLAALTLAMGCGGTGYQPPAQTSKPATNPPATSAANLTGDWVLMGNTNNAPATNQFVWGGTFLAQNKDVVTNTVSSFFMPGACGQTSTVITGNVSGNAVSLELVISGLTGQLADLKLSGTYQAALQPDKSGFWLAWLQGTYSGTADSCLNIPLSGNWSASLIPDLTGKWVELAGTDINGNPVYAFVLNLSEDAVGNLAGTFSTNTAVLGTGYPDCKTALTLTQGKELGGVLSFAASDGQGTSATATGTFTPGGPQRSEILTFQGGFTSGTCAGLTWTALLTR